MSNLHTNQLKCFQMSMLQQIVDNVPFFCKGSFKINEEGVKLFYATTENDSKCVNFPLPHNDKDCLISLLENGVQATFGKNFESVLDETYRSAKTYHADRFATTLDISSSDILDQIEYCLLPQKKGSLRCTKYRMNIYEKGGHFKDHQDTPESSNMFGSLVVLLPITFTGGELILKKNGIEISGFDKDKKDEVQWIAFYGDVTHKVTEVLSGTRITLTYKLFNNSSVVNNINIDKTQYLLSKEELTKLKEELLKKVTFCDYDFMGFGCQFQYSESLKHHNKSDVLTFLKGSDMILYSALKALNLDPVISDIYHKEETLECIICYEDIVTEMCYREVNDLRKNYKGNINRFYNDHVYCLSCVLDESDDYFFLRYE